MRYVGFFEMSQQPHLKTTIRKSNINAAKVFLENKGYEVDRSFFGSEDGEAILYRKRGTEDWHFLCHLDPLFVEIEDVEEYVKEAMEDIQ